MAESRLAELAARGQSVWIDLLSREFVHSGELKRLVDEDSVTGLTSNPSIFQKAIAGGGDYDAQIRASLEETDDPREIFLRLAVDDVRDACDVLRPVWDATGGADGYVSLEVDPGLAHDERRHGRPGGRAPRAGRPAERLHQDPGHGRGRAGDRGVHRAGDPDQRDADLLRAALPACRRGVPCAASRGCRSTAATSRRSARSPRSSSRASTPRPTRSSRPSATPSSRGSSASPTRSSPTSTSRSSSTGRSGSGWRRRARPCSGRSGRRPRRRTRPTGTSCTSRS